MGLGRLAELPCAGALQRLDRTRDVDVDEGVELLEGTGGEPVALAFALGAVDDTDRSLQPRIANEIQQSVVVGLATMQRPGIERNASSAAASPNGRASVEAMAQPTSQNVLAAA